MPAWHSIKPSPIANTIDALTHASPTSTQVDSRLPNKQRILNVLLLLSTLYLAGCAANPVKQHSAWFAKDKAFHFATSTALSAGLAATAKQQNQSDCDAALIGFSISLAIGAGKESYDKRVKKTLYSYRDMVWNMAGAAVGSLLASGCH